MAESEHDDLADALARMAKGDVAPGEHGGEHELATPSTPPARPAPRPAPARGPAPMIKPPRPAAPALGAQSPPPATAPVPRPAAPALAAGTTSTRKARPTAPAVRQSTSAPTDAETDGGQSTALSAGAEGAGTNDDDDSVIVPAPEASVFMPKAKSTSTAEVRAAIARKKNLNFRRTLIPPLLTLGVLMIVFGFLKPLSGPDSMFANLWGGIPVILFIAGAVLLGVAAINMLSVKAQLEAEKNSAK